MTLDRLKAICSVVLLISVTILVMVCTYYVYRIGERTNATLAEVRLTANRVKKVVDTQGAFLNSKESQLLVRNNLAIGSAAISTIRLINTQTVPRINAAIDRFDAAGNELTLLVRNTDHSVNGNIAPALTKTIQDTDETILTTGKLLNDVLAQLTPQAAEVLLNLSKSSSQLGEILSDPSIKSALQEIAASSAEVHQSTESLKASSLYLEQAFKQFPEIAADIRAYTKATSRSTKYVIAARIVAALIPIVGTLPH